MTSPAHAPTEEVASTPSCHSCQRALRVGEDAWASDWTVIDGEGIRTEDRYTCDECAA